MISAFGVEHGDIEKGFGDLVRGAGRSMFGGGGKRIAGPGGETPMHSQLAAKYGIKPPAGGAHKAGAGAHRGTLKPKSFNPFGGGGSRVAGVAGSAAGGAHRGSAGLKTVSPFGAAGRRRA